MTPDHPDDPDLRELDLNGMRATYTDDGSGDPAFVFVHGLPGSVRDFRYLGAALRQVLPTARMVRLNMPGFGGTDARLGGKMTVEARARFVVDALAALELHQVVLVGHSMGGAVTIGASALAPQRVRNLVLLSSVGLTPHRLYRSLKNPPVMARVVCSPPGRWLLSGWLRRQFVRSGFPSSTPTAALFETIRAVGALRFAAVRDFVRRVAALKIPTHLLQAEDDPLIERAIVQRLTDALHGTLRTFDTGGHNIQKTRAVEIAELLAAIHRSSGRIESGDLPKREKA